MNANIKKTSPEYSGEEKIKVEGIFRDVQSNEVSVTLSTLYMGKTVYQTISRDNLNSKGLKELAKFGFPILNKDETNEFINYFIENEEEFPVLNIYKTVGWHDINNKSYFLHRKAVIDSKVKNVQYNGILDLSSDGSMNDFIEFFENTISKSIGLQTACAVALASAIVGMITEKDLKFIFHIEGVSTSGKTTSLMLAGSLWGNPEISPHGVVRNWNTTNNKLIQSVGGNNGVLVCLDELSMSKADNTQLTYLLTGGTDKQRMTNDSSANDEFRTIFMSTGEIQFKTSNFGGIGVRLFEVKNYNFTQNKETAEEISKFITNNYGIVGFEFVKALSGFSSEYICNKIDKYSKIVEKRIKTHTDEAGKAYSPLFSRMADKIAAVALAANIAKNKLEIDFNTSEIVDFLICDTTFLEMGQEQSVEAMDKFFEEYSKNKTKFPKDTSADSNIWGKTVVKAGVLSEIIVLYNQFVSMMKKVGFPDTASLIKALKGKGFIKCEEDKNYSRRNVGNIKRAKVIVIDVAAIKGGADDEN